MADEIDRANDIIDTERRQAIAAIRARLTNVNFVITNCADCGREIPAARRLALPGCDLCVRCQESFEREPG